MKKLTFFTSGAKNRQATRGGSYALAVSAVVLAIVVAVNVLVSSLPTSVTKYDISASQLYSITGNTKVVVNALSRDVTIYWVVQPGAEDQVIENLLGKYESLSDHIQVVKKNPDVYPTFTQSYTSETVQNNSLIVVCGDKYRYIAYEDIYIGEVNMYTGTYTADSFDGEGAITSAIDYVTGDEYPQVYLLQGHGEGTLPDDFARQIEKENMETQSLSLLTAEGVPAEADCVLVYAPQSDISEAEKELLAAYLSGGGKLWVCAGPTESGVLENLYSLLTDYGITAQQGIVVDTDRDHYALGAPIVLLPDISSSTVTDALLAENYAAVMPVALGLTVDGTYAGVTELLTTSYSAYSKTAGYELTTYDYEDGDVEGTFALAVSVETTGGGQMYWFTSSQFLEPLYNSYSSGANMDLAMNALAQLVGETEAMAIRTKSLDYHYLTISDSTAAALKVLLIGVFPLAYLAVGVGVTIKRKKVRHAAV